MAAIEPTNLRPQYGDMRVVLDHDRAGAVEEMFGVLGGIVGDVAAVASQPAPTDVRDEGHR